MLQTFVIFSLKLLPVFCQITATYNGFIFVLENFFELVQSYLTWLSSSYVCEPLDIPTWLPQNRLWIGWRGWWSPYTQHQPFADCPLLHSVPANWIWITGINWSKYFCQIRFLADNCILKYCVKFCIKTVTVTQDHNHLLGKQPPQQTTLKRNALWLANYFWKWEINLLNTKCLVLWLINFVMHR